jgi:carbonic anhydrase
MKSHRRRRAGWAWALAWAGCTTTTTTADPTTTVLTHPAQALSADPRLDRWGYRGVLGPSGWADLGAAYATCRAGRSQSPVDLAEAAVQPGPPLAVAYVPVPLRAVHDGHTVVLDLARGGTLELDGKTFQLTQAHFHHPSEHTVDGAGQPMELHLVHVADDGAMAVVAVFLRAGAENVALRPLFGALPETHGSALNGEGLIDPADLLPTDRHAFAYEGSLTVPPCTEGVRWLVLRTPIELSLEQLDAFARLFPLNARPVQKRGDRAIHVDALP